MSCDAVVIGAGPNGLVAANVLADAGWDVLVLEAADEPGGAVKSAQLVEPGFVSDVFSSFYPLAAFSPALARLELERFGLRWRQAPVALAHPSGDGTCVVVSSDLDETAASLGRLGPGDGDAWRDLVRLWRRLEPAARRALVTPFPPLVAAVGAARALGLRELAALGRELLLPARRFGDERFRGDGAKRLLAGTALHADLTPESALGGFFGFVLAAVGQSVGFPTPAGGAGNLTRSLVTRLESRGGRIALGRRVTEVVVRRDAAVGVRTAAGESIPARRAILAAVDAPSLYTSLLPADAVPARMRAAIARFEWDWSTIKVDWSLDRPVPWTSEDARRAGVVHVADSVDELTVFASELSRRLLPARPFVVFGQYSPLDPTRMPPGREVAWAYTRLPRAPRGDAAGELSGQWLAGEAERFADRIEQRVERLAPGFRSSIRRRHVLLPADLERLDSNLSAGALNGGTAQLHQQLVFRPVPGLGRPETPVRRLYLASASAHPGGGVHGSPGAIAARAALRADRLRQTLRLRGS